MSGHGGGFNDDVNNDEYKSLELTLNSDPEVEATTGLVEYRQWVRIYNKGPQDIEYGPTGGPYEPLFKNQGVTLNHGPDNRVYIKRTSGNPVVLIQESG